MTGHQLHLQHFIAQIAPGGASLTAAAASVQPLTHPFLQRVHAVVADAVRTVCDLLPAAEVANISLDWPVTVSGLRSLATAWSRVCQLVQKRSHRLHDQQARTVADQDELVRRGRTQLLDGCVAATASAANPFALTPVRWADALRQLDKDSDGHSETYRVLRTQERERLQALQDRSHHPVHALTDYERVLWVDFLCRPQALVAKLQEIQRRKP